MSDWLRMGLGLAVVLCACADSHHERREPADPAAASGKGLGQAGAGSEPRTTTRVLGDPGSPAETQVWIGQLWLTGGEFCKPARDETWLPPGTTVRVVLVLEPNAAGERGGRILFGDGRNESLPESPDSFWIDHIDVSFNSFWYCSTERAVEGFEYTLFDVVRSATHVSFSYAPNELWNRWCETAKPECPEHAPCNSVPFCLCEDGACAADVRKRTLVWLAATRDTLEGDFPGEQPSAIRLRRVR